MYQSRYAQHILETGHTYGTIETHLIYYIEKRSRIALIEIAAPAK
jgi:hypothetical protein